MKVEDLPVDCKNLLAVSESYICYSVTQKKNLLRVIDTRTGEKVILRSHESAVLDLKFSPSDSSLVCSIDNGENPSCPHLIIWQRDVSSPEFCFKMALQMNLSGTMVDASPTRTNMWLISDQHSMGVIDATVFIRNPAGAGLVKAYADLPLTLESPIKPQYTISGM